jgi:hypothetical protein
MRQMHWGRRFLLWWGTAITVQTFDVQQMLSTYYILSVLHISRRYGKDGCGSAEASHTWHWRHSAVDAIL